MAASSVKLDAPVITIIGLCPKRLKKIDSSCRTVITRTQFETMIGAVQPNMSARARREFANRYAEALVMGEKARQMRLDQGVNFEEQMKVARIQLLSQTLNKAIEREASQISDQEIAHYYSKNMLSFEQVEMDRVYVPKRQQRVSTDKVSCDADKGSQSQQAEQTMQELAEKLHDRATAGEDFDKLQRDAFEIVGIKGASSSMGKIRRTSLPPSQTWVVNLKPGEVSPVIADTNGYIIYKIKTKDIIPLDQAREEIKGILRTEHIQREMHDIEESAVTTFDESYFAEKPPTASDKSAGHPVLSSPSR